MWKKSKSPSIPPKKTLVQETTVVQSASYSWPIPPPALMKEYNEICPGSADRILTMAEKQSNHRIELEKKYTHESLSANKRWQIFAFIVMILIIWFWSFLIYLWKEISWFIAFFTGIAWTLLWIIKGNFWDKDKEKTKETRNGKEVIEW